MVYHLFSKEANVVSISKTRVWKPTQTFSDLFDAMNLPGTYNEKILRESRVCRCFDMLKKSQFGDRSYGKARFLTKALRTDIKFFI